MITKKSIPWFIEKRVVLQWIGNMVHSHDGDVFSILNSDQTLLAEKRL